MFKKPYGKSGGDWKQKPAFGKPAYDNSLHSATCSQCGNDCQVPFKPNGRKPVFCSNCFVKEDKFGGDRGHDRDGGSNFYEKKSSYQSRPYGRPDSRPSMNGITTEQFKSLNAKLDMIIKLLRGEE